MKHSIELARLGLMCAYALDERLTDTQMQVFRIARAAGECPAAAYGRARKWTGNRISGCS